ncbi:DUF2452 domain-containing protein [Congregibacter litoralis]|uniref:DUF2452 domain-containing protein n=1 Tax=Congregibacter litoralis KT71 TaxID=314285 RepID=A4A441_9GAMM|nr:DUF2452 domain-containing protein [Congregibacter litoralis]EAQ99464.1 hypothetical protein KT71_17381 [Congregibacter litoralis KT71]
MNRNPYKNPNPQGKGLVPVMAHWQETRPATVRAKAPAELLFDWFASVLVLSAKFQFKPAMGQLYFLYAKGGEWQLSLVGPDEWGDRDMGDCLGTCELAGDMTWSITPDEGIGDNERLQNALGSLVDAFMSSLESDEALDAHLPGYRRELPYYQRMLATGLGASLRQSATAANSLQSPLKLMLEEAGAGFTRRLLHSD